MTTTDNAARRWVSRGMGSEVIIPMFWGIGPSEQNIEIGLCRGCFGGSSQHPHYSDSGRSKPQKMSHLLWMPETPAEAFYPVCCPCKSRSRNDCEINSKLLNNPCGPIDNPSPWAYPAKARAEACQCHANTPPSTPQRGPSVVCICMFGMVLACFSLGLCWVGPRRRIINWTGKIIQQLRIYFAVISRPRIFRKTHWTICFRGSF